MKQATTIVDTQIVSIRRPPVNVPKGTKIVVWDEAAGWGLVDATIKGNDITGEMWSEDYKEVSAK